MSNLLLEDVRYKITETSGGTWRRFMYPQGTVFAEYTAKRQVFGLPLLHFTSGINPETGFPKVAKGFIAIGRRAVGVVAIGRFAAGIVGVGQLSLGLLGLGQLTAGVLAVGQGSLGVLLGIGQLATGYVCIAQLGFGEWVLAQIGFGEHVWSMRVKDPTAIEFFKSLAKTLGFSRHG